MAKVEIKSVWDGDTTSYLVYVDGKRKGAHWTYEDAKAEADRYESTKEGAGMREKLMKLTREQLIAVCVRQDKKVAEIRGYESGMDAEKFGILDSKTLIDCFVQKERDFNLNTTLEEENAMNKGMVEVTQITVDGIVYTNTRPGYYYKRVDGKQVRIPKAEWEEAFKADAARREQEEQAKKEQAKKEEQVEMDHYTVETFYAGMTGYVVKKNGEEVYNGFSVDEIIERFGFNPNEVTEIDMPRAKEEKKAKKVRKARRPKDIAHESNGVTLTAKQADFIKHVPDTCFYENGLESVVWCDVLADEIGGQFAGKPMTVGAMISTLREKSLIYVGVDRVNGRKAKFFGFTELGKKVAQELGLN